MFKTTLILLALILLTLILTGCLDFGEDIETEKPTAEQILQSRSEMHINKNLQIKALGYKLQGSGIDDAINFKFKTKTTDLTTIFKPEFVNIENFETLDLPSTEQPKPSWWNLGGKKVLYQQVMLPYGPVMDIYIEQRDNSLMIYIFWYNT